MNLEIKTTRFGHIKIEDEKILEMPYGMPGFPSRNKFVLFAHKEDSPFLWFQSIEDPALAFVMTNPYLFKSDYDIKLDEIISQLSWQKDQDDHQLELLVVVNIPKDAPEKITANLIGPVLINNRRRQAVQVIISDSPYTHKFPLLKAIPE